MRLFGWDFFTVRVSSSSLWLMVCSLAWWGSALPCLGDDGWEGEIAFLNVDNDAVSGTDRHYTHGAHAGWFSRDDHLPGFFNSVSGAIPACGLDVQAQKWGIGAGQELFTPGNLQTSELILNDRPYAGWLFGNVTLQRRGQASFGGLAMETFRVDVGVVGPPALGEEAQDLVHNKKAKGWNNQLSTEPGIVLNYNRRYRFAWRSRDEFWGLDFIPHGGVSAGNVATYLAAGPTFRFGINVPNEFAAGAGVPTRFGAYLFTGAEGRLVLRNIFLNGNTFQESHHVEKIWLVGDFKVGLTVVLKAVELTVAQTLRSPEFEGQKDTDMFGSATVTVKF